MNVIVSENSALSCLAKLGELDLLGNFIGVAYVLTNAAAAGLVDLGDVFHRLAQTKFRLGAAVVADLRHRLEQAKK